MSTAGQPKDLRKDGRERMARKKRRRRATALREHRRHKKTLTPPLLSLGGIKPVSYLREFLPDLLWIAALFDQRSAWDAAYEPLDLIEEIAPPDEVERSGRKVLLLVDGRISAFDYVPEAVRADVRAALADKTPWALPDELGHALALYPECPAGWLFDDWRATNSADPEIGLRYLKRLVSHYGDRETEQQRICGWSRSRDSRRPGSFTFRRRWPMNGFVIRAGSTRTANRRSERRCVPCTTCSAVMSSRPRGRGVG